MAAVTLPVLLLLLGIVIPLGWLGSPEVTYAALRSLLVDSIAIRGVLVVIHAGVFWHAAHQLRQLLRDLGWQSASAIGAFAYSMAIVGALWSVQVLSAF